ncbi:MAG: TIGR00341 family protein, partial [Bacteroidales bacterium]|nr:TIGR00341 family protein [Bacteroidales bacterium]
MKRLVAQHKSSRHQHHKPMDDELVSCSTTPIYNKVVYAPTADQRLHNSKVAVDHPVTSKTEPPISKTVSNTKASIIRNAPKATTTNRQQPITSNVPQATKEITTTKSTSAKGEEPEENIWWVNAWRWLRRLLDFREDKAGDVATIESLKADVEFRGTKLWILICAILVASI